MSTGEFQTLAIVLLAVAWWRKRDATVFALATGFALSAMFPLARHGAELLPFIAITDAGIVLAMLAIWTAHDSMRAWFVGFIGLAKCGWTFAAASGGIPGPWLVYAVGLNCAFLAQVCIAGGFADAANNWLDRHARRLVPRRYRMLRNGAR